jgi:hypothetical protein
LQLLPIIAAIGIVSSAERRKHFNQKKFAMLINIIKLCKDQNIPYATEGGKHCRPGWVQLHCPYCGYRDKWFLGYNLASGALCCWHCGKHQLGETLRLLLRCDRKRVGQLIENYIVNKITKAPLQVRASEKQRPLSVKLPPMCSAMEARHKNYLAKRKYDPDRLEREWGLMGTGIHGGYKNRIILPITLNRKMVSYQGRDITNKHALKYKACCEVDEVIHHKHILYGVDLVPGDVAVIVEGAADAWRLGPGAVATFGTGFTLPQLNLFCRLFKRGFILFDPEPEAQARAEKAGMLLSARGIDVEILEINGDYDPGDMPQDEADNLMKELLR